MLDYSCLLFVCWFCGGIINLCYNVVDCWLDKQLEVLVLIVVLLEIDEECIFIFSQLYDEVNVVVVMLLLLGVQCGDCVLVYMLMIVEVQIILLVCVCIGVIYLVVFGGFVLYSVVVCIDDVRLVLIVLVDVGVWGGKILLYKKLFDDVIVQVQYQLKYVLLVDRGLVKMVWVDGCDLDFVMLCQQYFGVSVLVVWLEFNEILCIFYIFGIIGKLKGVQCDVGGYVVVLVILMDIIFGGKVGGVFFCVLDIGWVVGYFYIVYVLLLVGMVIIVYEGLLMYLDCGVWWKIVEKYQVNWMFFVLIVICVLKKFLMV